MEIKSHITKTAIMLNELKIIHRNQKLRPEVMTTQTMTKLQFCEIMKDEFQATSVSHSY